MGLHPAHAAHGAVRAGAHRELWKKKVTKPKSATEQPQEAATVVPEDCPCPSHPSGAGQGGKYHTITELLRLQKSFESTVQLLDLEVLDFQVQQSTQHPH